MRFIHLCAAVLVALLPVAALAATTPNSAILPQTPRQVIGTIINANGTTPQTLVSGGTNGSKVTSITCSNTDTASYTLQLLYQHSATNYVLDSVTIAVSAGNVAGTVPQPLLSTSVMPGASIDGSGNPYLFLMSGDSLMIATTGAVTAAKTIACSATVADF